MGWFVVGWFGVVVLIVFCLWFRLNFCFCKLSSVIVWAGWFLFVDVVDVDVELNVDVDVVMMIAV